MPASSELSLDHLNLSTLRAFLSPSAPGLLAFTGGLLLLLYGYEIFNFTLSIDEEVFLNRNDWARMVVGHGRWGTALLTRIFPPFGNIPMISTILFCVGVGFSAYVLARIFSRKHAAQYAFAGIFVAYPIWPHIAEFNISAWCVGIGCVLLTFCLLLFLAEHRLADILAAVLLAFAMGITETFCVWFLVLLCIRHMSVMLDTAGSDATPAKRKLPWLRAGIITVAALLLYFVVQRLSLRLAIHRLDYVQGLVRLDYFFASPALAIRRTLGQCFTVLSGYHRIFLGYGPVVMLLPLIGFLIIVVQLLRRGSLTISERLLTGSLLVAAFLFALSPTLVTAGGVPIRALIALAPLIAFLAAVAFSKSLRLVKPLYVVLAVTLFISMWINVSLFYTDNLVRQRDQVLATRIMTRVDSILPNPPPGKIPFVIVAARPWTTEANFQKVEIFGDSYFDTSHEGGNPARLAAYLSTLGVNTLAPRRLADAVQHRDVIAAMPIWPAAGSVAMVEGILVIKLGPGAP
ncbi:MAG TPA: glucosyltransferase domain-containing protein [Pyrinomonadaceae bacterium]|nr:glucosyltransferase domain-containing protein [Pyrinomonadaceae bacterium]